MGQNSRIIRVIHQNDYGCWVAPCAPSTDRQVDFRLHCADAFVFPSVKEGWGLVVLEAIASRLPTIVSQQAPFTEFLTPEQTLFVNPFDSEAMAQKMVQSIQPSITHALIQNSQSVIAQYSWKASATMHISHYQRFIHARNPL
jgi:glycosyltransferase involved in cell wall biosynthesis